MLVVQCKEIGETFGGERMPDTEEVLERFFEVDCEACDTLCEILIDVYVTDEFPSYCPFCGSPVSAEG